MFVYIFKLLNNIPLAPFKGGADIPLAQFDSAH